MRDEDERRASPQSAADAIDELCAAGALCALFAKVDAGEVKLTNGPSTASFGTASNVLEVTIKSEKCTTTWTSAPFR